MLGQFFFNGGLLILFGSKKKVWKTQKYQEVITIGGGFQSFLIFYPDPWGNDPILTGARIFFSDVEMFKLIHQLPTDGFTNCELMDSPRWVV